MRYSSVTFQVPAIEDWQKDLLIDALGGIGYDTFEDIGDGFSAYIPTANLDVQALETVLLYEADGFDVQYTIQDMEDKNWNALWELNFSPIVVDDRCYVRASFHEPKPGMEYEIVINPKMSFGTGHHETTSMMLSYILENSFEGKTVLDMGCGTGILAILAAKRGASSILAVDYDDVCVASVAENKVLNDTPQIQSALGSKEAIVGHSFDVVLANINRNILVDQLAQYRLCLPADGLLFVSGFYDGEDLAILCAKAESEGFTFMSKKVQENWCSAKFVRNK
ncbi:50S ribosomal protein L11 methyltransferase [Sphingobacterium sp. MYb382]|uniref:50S ribosomal protein L11 methyltransferase n=1 Tax=Sphingobacterium sp. MYb382 TaxID=2745278 RepID=UPI0030B700B1